MSLSIVSIISRIRVMAFSMIAVVAMCAIAIVAVCIVAICVIAMSMITMSCCVAIIIRGLISCSLAAVISSAITA